MITAFDKRVKDTLPEGLYSLGVEILQVNLGFLCNQACSHCHVQASPFRKEIMERSTMELILKAASTLKCSYVELTGGAPEMNPDFKWFVHELTQAGHNVKVRTNLTVLVEPVTAETPKFLKKHRVKLLASMPCYLEANVNSQRGSGVFEKTIAALKQLNSLGYGQEPDLTLDLVYNPGGAFLPPSQQALEADYRRELSSRFGIVFNQLLTITNMPIGRFFAELVQEQKDNEYMTLLQQSFNPLTIDALMCCRQISIGWDGALYDCDFNLSLGVTVNHNAPAHVREFDVKALTKRRIVTGDHCFGCTAGSGSSCTGSLI